MSIMRWVFPKIGVPQNGWFIIENLIQMDDLGGTPIFGNTQMFCSHSLNVCESSYLREEALVFLPLATTQRARHRSKEDQPWQKKNGQDLPSCSTFFHDLLVLPSKMYNYIWIVVSTYLMHLLFQSWGKNPWFTRDPSKQFNPKVCKKP